MLSDQKPRSASRSQAQNTTWRPPDTELTENDRRYGDVHVQAWSGRHPKLSGRGRWAGPDAPPIVRGTIIPLPNETSRVSLWEAWLAAAGGSALALPGLSIRGLLTDRAPAGSPVSGLLLGCRARFGVST